MDDSRLLPYLPDLTRRRIISLPAMAAVGSLPAQAAPSWQQDLTRALQALVDDPQAPLASLSVLVRRQGRTLYEAQFGRRHVAPDLPVTPDTLFRMASVTKMIVALGVMRLVDAGRLDLDADIGEQLGYPLRNPHHPQQPITLRQLLSHRSSLQDDARANLEPGMTLKSALLPGGAHYGDGKSWSTHAPGSYFQYCNLAFGVVASVMERASSRRFDELMQAQVLAPLGMQGGFDPATFPSAQLANVATLYRKQRPDGHWDVAGPWVPQTDDYSAAAPLPVAQITDYLLGSNGALFGPQGRLRTRVRDLGTVMAMLLAGGLHQGRRYLSAVAVKTLMSEQWRFDPKSPNGDDDDGLFQAWGTGLQHFIDRSGPGPGRGDRLRPAGGIQAWGHLGFAYGLQSGLLFEPRRQAGVAYAIGGTAADGEALHGRYSSYSPWEEEVVRLLWGAAL